MYTFSIGRASEIWKVSESAKSINPNRWSRSDKQATLHRPLWTLEPPRPAQTPVSKAALTAVPSERVVELAEPVRLDHVEKTTYMRIGRPSVITVVRIFIESVSIFYLCFAVKVYWVFKFALQQFRIIVT